MKNTLKNTGKSNVINSNSPLEIAVFLCYNFAIGETYEKERKNSNSRYDYGRT